MAKHKRIITLILAALLFITAVPLPSIAKEDIKGQKTLANADFEKGVIGKKAEGWTLKAAGSSAGNNYNDENPLTNTSNYTLTISDDSYKGNKALSFAAPKGTRGYVLAESDYLCVDEMKNYSLGYAFKLDLGDNPGKFDGAKVLIYQFDKDGKPIAVPGKVDSNKNPVLAEHLGNVFTEGSDWEYYRHLISLREDAAYIKIAFYMVGKWGDSVGAQILVDNIEFEQLSEEELLNGGFELGQGVKDIYSWHMTSKTLQNNDDANHWERNYEMVRDENGYHGDSVRITRKGIGYISLDSNIFEATPKATYVIDFALKVENSDKTCPGVRAYLVEYDKNHNKIATTGLHSIIQDNMDWTELSYSIVTNENTAYIQVSFFCAGGKDTKFSASFDDVRITKIVRHMSEDGINNGNFEEVVDGTVLDWFLSKAEDVSYASTFEGYNNTKALKVTKTSKEKHGYATLRSNEFQVVEGKDYKLTYMSRLEKQVGSVYIVAQMMFNDKDGKLIERQRTQEFDHRTKSDEWLQEVGYFTAPKGAVTCKLELLVCGTSYECWLDDIVWSTRDDKANVYGFDAVDKSGNLMGWTVTQPAASKVDKKVYRQGTSSLFVSQTTNTTTCRVMSDVLIPVEPETRYKFSVWVSNYGCDVTTDGMALHAYKYSKDGKFLGKITGNTTTMNAEDEPSNWRELICGVSTKLDVAYVRLYLEVGAGTMNFWVDDLKWCVYSSDNEFADDFDIICEDGTPDGWSAVALSGKPKFVTSDSVVSIQASGKDDVGMITTKWNTAQEYTPFTFTTTYKATADTKATLTIKFYDYADRELKNQRIEKSLDSTGGVWTDYSFQFVSPAMVYAKIELGNEGDGIVAFEGLSIVKYVEETEELPVDDWRGKWIWYREDHYGCPNSTRYFRYHVNVPGTPEIGSLQITGDDRVKLWINDMEISLGDEAKEWGSISSVEGLQDYMVTGDNIIAIEVSNDSSAGALLFDGYVETDDGTRVDLYSNGTVLSSTEKVDGWNTAKFDDSKWIASKIIGEVGMPPWGNFEFDASPYIKEAFEVLEYEITEELEVGEEAKLTMTILPEEDFTKELDLKGALWIRNSNTKVLEVGLNHIDGPAMNEWKAGKKVTVSYTFTVPDFVGSGKYILQLSVNQVKVTNMELLNNKLKQAIRISNDIEKEGATIKTEIKEVNGTQTFYINGEAQPAMLYLTQAKAGYSGGLSEVYMHDAGVCITRLHTRVAGSNPLPIWTGEGEYDFTTLDEMIYGALSDHQDTYIMVSCNMDVPTWWQEKYPDEMILTSEGVVPGVSFASDKFKEDAIAANIAMLEYMMEQPYANRIVGVMLTACKTNEWIWYGAAQSSMDHSKAAQTKFREWLKDTYGTNQKLQEAWNRKGVTIETAEIPTFEERQGTTYETILDPTTQRDCIDYNEFMGAVVADMLNEFSTSVSETIDDRLMLGAYYGYIQNIYNYMNINTAHTGVGKVLDAEHVDFFVAPAIYGERDDGEYGGFMQMIDSVFAHGKAVLVEADIRTCSYVDLDNNFYQRDEVGPTYNMSDTLSQMERNFANQLISGAGEWWTNLGGNYWEREQFSELIEIMYNERVVNLARENDADNEVCYIIDEDMFTQMTHEYDANYEYFLWLLSEQRLELSRIGVSVDTYYMSDLAKGLIPDHKIYIMLSPIEVDETERAAIEKYLKKDNQVVVWQCLSGVSDGRKFSAKGMSELIGINVTLDDTIRSVSGTFANKKHWLIDGLQGDFYGNRTAKQVVSPTGIINDEKATILGYMYDNPTQAALAIKEMGDWTSIYSAVPCLPTELIRNLLEECDVHIYSENRNDVIFVNNNYVAVNTAYGGKREIKLDGTYAVYDVYGQKTYSLSTDTIKLTMEDNSTRLFRLTSADKHVVYVDLDANGSSKQEGYNEVKPGKDYECTIKANDGYLISAIKIDGETTEVRDKTYKINFKDLDNSHFVKAEFVRVSEEAEKTFVENTFPTYIFWIFAGAIVLTTGAIVTLLILEKKGSRNDEKNK